ncbi:hypothetical protein [Mesorhizobium sp. CO1-1-8]|uniref:hypothetical protein n=1 Tax=Mesorhizobium sp. CO1-1-8 TaxID=2876631 RepID=UPI001CD0D2FD|nr:hypothetical protein [Mesorhizobium sp. CO1-1-8]MBZ9772320.1 hypothetical protein [Mesorhizobium sp. CO1-1-8]
MSLSMSPNPDGTITVTCGTDSLTIAPPIAPKPRTSADIPVLWPNGGATASIIAKGNAKIRTVPVPSGNDLVKAIKEQYTLYVEASEPTVFQFHVNGSGTLSVEEINKALSDLGNPEWMGTQIKLTGPHDE